MGIFTKIASVFKTTEVKDYIDDLEDVLLESGLSPKLSYDILAEVERKSFSGVEKVKKILQDTLRQYAVSYSFTLPAKDAIPHVFLFVGVNGVGKTTSIAKFVNYLNTIHSVPTKDIVVAAGDTFRAGAIEQIAIHCERLGVPLIKQDAGSDPAAVVFDSLSYASSRGIPFLVIDTAGRMHNRKDLIEQLQKIYRILCKKLDSSQITTFIVLDGNSGQNTLTQVEDFSEAIPVTSFILSKYDGSTKGGTVLSIVQQYGLPCSFLGIGETYDAFVEFNAEKFIDDFLS